jgi:hypothetical protein
LRLTLGKPFDNLSVKPRGTPKRSERLRMGSYDLLARVPTRRGKVMAAENSTKRPYQKPTIERIDLIGEEMAQTTSCKGQNRAGKSQPRSCQIGGAVTSCKTAYTS